MGEAADADGLTCPLAAEGLVCSLGAAVGAAAVGEIPALLAAGLVDRQPITRTAATLSVRKKKTIQSRLLSSGCAAVVTGHDLSKLASRVAARGQGRSCRGAPSPGIGSETACWACFGARLAGRAGRPGVVAEAGAGLAVLDDLD